MTKSENKQRQSGVSERGRALTSNAGREGEGAGDERRMSVNAGHGNVYSTSVTRRCVVLTGSRAR